MRPFLPIGASINIRTYTQPSAAHSKKRQIHMTGVTDLRRARASGIRSGWRAVKNILTTR